MASRRTADSGSRSVTVARVVAFSDAVIAIIITIMVLELKGPVFLEGTIQSDFDFSFLYSLAPKFLAYLISFSFIATAWFAHVSAMRGLNRSSMLLLWLNTLFLFFLKPHSVGNGIRRRPSIFPPLSGRAVGACAHDCAFWLRASARMAHS